MKNQHKRLDSDNNREYSYDQPKKDHEEALLGLAALIKQANELLKSEEGEK